MSEVITNKDFNSLKVYLYMISHDYTCFMYPKCNRASLYGHEILIKVFSEEPISVWKQNKTNSSDKSPYQSN